MRTVKTQNFVKILRAVFEIWTKNIKNAPKMGVFPHLRPPKIFFQKSGSVTFVPLWCTNFMQKIRKILRAVSEIFKDGRTNGRTNGLTDMGDYIGPLSGTPGVQNRSLWNHGCCHRKNFEYCDLSNLSKRTFEGLMQSVFVVSY